MKPVLDEKDAIFYISDADMIKFIAANSDMKWNDVWNFARNKHITPSDRGQIFWNKDGIAMFPNEHNQEQIKWVGAFFEAHPWIVRMMIVFDD